MAGALFVGKSTFASTGTGAAPRYLTSEVSAGLIAPVVDATLVTEKERCLLYRPSGASDDEVIIQLGGLAYLSALHTEGLGLVNGQPDLDSAYRFKLVSSAQTGEVEWQIFLPDQKRWAPVRYTVDTPFPYLTFPLTGDEVRSGQTDLLTMFTQQQTTPSLASIQSSRSAQGCDLRHVDLTGADLTEVDFTGADLTGAILNGARLKKAVLTEAVLTSASLVGTDLSGATLDGAVMSGLDLTKVVWGDGTGLSARGTHLEHCFGMSCQLGSPSEPYADFTKAYFEGADFTGACLDNARLVEAFMIGGVFVGASFDGADLGGAHLGGISRKAAANLAYAYMPNVNLEAANLFGVSFAFASLFGASTLIAGAASLEQADFSNAYLEGVSLKGAPLQGAKFDNACLVRADFTGASLSPTLAGSVASSLAGACLHGAIFTDAKLAGADFSGATVSFQRGGLQVRYCTPQGPFPSPPDFERLNYLKGTQLDLQSMQPSTICPNGNTVLANQTKGLSLRQMLTVADPATSWLPVRCFWGSPDRDPPLVETTQDSPPEGLVCETAHAVVRAPDMGSLRDVCRLGRDPGARRFFFRLNGLPADRAAALIRYHRKAQEETGLSCWPAYRKADDAFVGLFALHQSELVGGIGFTAAVMPEFRGDGLVKEISRAVLGYGFSRGGFDRIVALVDPENLAAQRFAEKLGFRRLDDVIAPNGVTFNLYQVRRSALIEG